jgi:hypothetical protein
MQPDHTTAYAGDGADTFSAVKGNPMSAIVSIAGAVTSVALLIGVGVWGYKLVVRDVSGVPVVRAAEGPMRALPDDPGGELARNQGLAVNAVAASGTAEGPADQVILAPQPLDLDAGDQMPTLAADPATPVGDGNGKSVEALVNELMAGAEPIGTLSSEEVIQPASLTQEDAASRDAAPATDLDVDQAVAAAIAEAVQGGMGKSLRPRLRPAKGQRVASLTPAAAGPLDLRAEALAVGPRLAQLGAYESQAIARKEWDRMARRFSDFMDGKQRVIQKAQSAGSTFYRLRVHGFEDMSDARRFCAALQAEGAECISVSHK